ncbi:MAG TPA: hypothetical protein VM659_28595 [Dongiaceae bacterium]|nr:hypothetical protein [Dongiaceae bacterium]
MSPEEAISMLDRQLANNGKTVTVKKRIDGSLTNLEQYTCKTMHRTWTKGRGSDELAGGVQQQYVLVVFSPTDIPAGFGTAAGGQQWPDVGDIISADGRDREIKASNPIKMDDVLVRINCQLVG